MPDGNRYDDIIDLPHHTSPTRPRMSPMNRAAQFAPFAALTGFGDEITEAARLTEQRAELSEESRAAIGQKLSLLRSRLAERPFITVTWFRPDDKKQGGAYLRAAGRLKKIRELEGDLILEDGRVIPFDDIQELDGDVFGALP